MSDYLVDIDGDGIVTVTLNRPDSLNAITNDMFVALRNEFADLSRNPEVGAVVLTGAGKAFCAGGDVKGMKGNASTLTYEERVAGLRYRHELATILDGFPKVTVAMVNGSAAGAGFALALACDFRLAGASARFMTSFVNVGFAGDFGGTYFLSRIVGTARAKQLYLTSERLDAQRALDLGIVSNVYADDVLAAETRAFVRPFAQGPRLAHAYIKRNFAAAESGSLQDVLDMEAFNQIRLAVSEDHTEAVRAFAEKRTPVFRGR